jgi:hypothetical protein
MGDGSGTVPMSLKNSGTDKHINNKKIKNKTKSTCPYSPVRVKTNLPIKPALTFTFRCSHFTHSRPTPHSQLTRTPRPSQSESTCTSRPSQSKSALTVGPRHSRDQLARIRGGFPVQPPVNSSYQFAWRWRGVPVQPQARAGGV